MAGVVKAMESAMKSMNLEKVCIQDFMLVYSKPHANAYRPNIFVLHIHLKDNWLIVYANVFYA